MIQFKLLSKQLRWEMLYKYKREEKKWLNTSIKHFQCQVHQSESKKNDDTSINLEKLAAALDDVRTGTVPCVWFRFVVATATLNGRRTHLIN